MNFCIAAHTEAFRLSDDPFAEALRKLIVVPGKIASCVIQVNIFHLLDYHHDKFICSV